MSSLMHITWTAYLSEPPKIPSQSHSPPTGESRSPAWRERRFLFCYSASAKATWEETADWDLALCLGWCHFLLAGQCAPHLHGFPYLFLSRGCCSTWAEASEEALSWGSRSQATNRLTAEYIMNGGGEIERGRHIGSVTTFGDQMCLSVVSFWLSEG